MDDLYIDIYKFGTYYNPSQKHYGADVMVHCDWCLQSDIVSCIGWKEHDLCLNCIAIIDTMYYNGEIIDEESSSE